MNEGKFQKKYRDEVGEQWRNWDVYNKAIEIIKELEIALDTKNRQAEMRYNEKVPDMEDMAKVQRYWNYGIE